MDGRLGRCRPRLRIRGQNGKTLFRRKPVEMVPEHVVLLRGALWERRVSRQEAGRRWSWWVVVGVKPGKQCSTRITARFRLLLPPLTIGFRPRGSPTTASESKVNLRIGWACLWLLAMETCAIGRDWGANTTVQINPGSTSLSESTGRIKLLQVGAGLSISTGSNAYWFATALGVRDRIGNGGTLWVKVLKFQIVPTLHPFDSGLVHSGGRLFFWIQAAPNMTEAQRASQISTSFRWPVLVQLALGPRTGIEWNYPPTSQSKGEAAALTSTSIERKISTTVVGGPVRRTGWDMRTLGCGGEGSEAYRRTNGIEVHRGRRREGCELITRSGPSEDFLELRYGCTQAGTGRCVGNGGTSRPPDYRQDNEYQEGLRSPPSGSWILRLPPGLDAIAILHLQDFTWSLYLLSKLLDHTRRFVVSRYCFCCPGPSRPLGRQQLAKITLQGLFLSVVDGHSRPPGTVRCMPFFGFNPDPLAAVMFARRYRVLTFRRQTTPHSLPDFWDDRDWSYRCEPLFSFSACVPKFPGGEPLPLVAKRIRLGTENKKWFALLHCVDPYHHIRRATIDPIVCHFRLFNSGAVHANVSSLVDGNQCQCMKLKRQLSPVRRTDSNGEVPDRAHSFDQAGPNTEWIAVKVAKLDPTFTRSTRVHSMAVGCEQHFFCLCSFDSSSVPDHTGELFLWAGGDGGGIRGGGGSTGWSAWR
ncbi:hypothetical protein C8R46DRAFT_1042392 [Mycena filopes]|nr:hypothetical protein C8R46DRAFT_1042392 [Mycena filopes]